MLHRLWGLFGSDGSRAEPAIDFRRETVILAAMGSWPSTGAGLRIDSVTTGNTDAGRATTVFLHVGVAGRNCVVGPAFTNPADAVVIPRDDHVTLIQYRERLVVDSCPTLHFHTHLPRKIKE